MKTISSSLQAHLQQDVTTVCTCWLITRKDGATFAFTDHDVDIVLDGTTYAASTGYTRTAIKSDADMSVDNMNIVGIMDSASITETDLKGGKFDYAYVQVFMVNWADLSMGILRLRAGWFGETVILPTGIFHTELHGLTQALTTEFVDQFSQLCRADLGDSKCTVNIATYQGSGLITGIVSQSSFGVGGVSGAGTPDVTSATVVFTKNAATGLGFTLQTGSKVQTYSIPYDYNSSDSVKFLATAINASQASGGIDATAEENFSADNVHAVIINLTVTTEGATITKTGDSTGCCTVQNFGGNSTGTIGGDGYLAGGLITWTTGLNSGLSMEIKSYDPDTGLMTLFLAMPFFLAVGDTFTYQPGCDKRRETCALRYNNMQNFRGEPDLPGLDKAMSAATGIASG